MKPKHLQLTHLGLAVFAAAMVLVAPAAHALTFDTKGNTNGDGTPKFIDPDEKVEQFGNSSVPGQPGSTTFRFEVGPSNNGFGGPSNDRFGPAGQYIPMPGMQTFPSNR
jgi:hypothetical protein